MPPNPFTRVSPAKPLVLDVRPILQKGGSPCDLIDKAIASLKPGQNFVLLVPFEPIPLYAKLTRDGFLHRKERMADGAWRIEFEKIADTAPSTGKKRQVAGDPPTEGKEIRLDNRGLEPPEPMVRTLEAVGRLGHGDRLVMMSDRKPVHLFHELEARGFAFDCGEQPDRSFVTMIWLA